MLLLLRNVCKESCYCSVVGMFLNYRAVVIMGMLVNDRVFVAVGILSKVVLFL